MFYLNKIMALRRGVLFFKESMKKKKKNVIHKNKKKKIQKNQK